MQANSQITEKMLGLVHNIAELLTKYSIGETSAITAQGKSNSLDSVLASNRE